MNVISKRYPAVSRISFFFYKGVLLVAAFLLLFCQLAVAEGAKFQKKAEFAWVKRNGELFDIGYSFHDGSG